MKATPFLILLCIFSMLPALAGAQEYSSSDTSISEDIEWTRSWVVSANDHDLPRILVIGDSHADAYYPVLSEQLKDRAYTCKYTTSRSLGDPVLMKQLSWFLNTYHFDVIAFNNGLHGVAYSLERYENSIAVVYGLFRETNPEAKLVWINTTARRVPNDIAQLDSLNAQVIERNQAVSQFASEKHIPVVDSYTLSADHPEYYRPDGVHFNEEGIREEASGVAGGIVKML